MGRLLELLQAYEGNELNEEKEIEEGTMVAIDQTKKIDILGRYGLLYRKQTIPVTISMEWIDEERAQELLKHQYGKQRSKYKANIDRFVDAMNADEWVEALCFPLFLDVDGELLDGQHRLTALVRTGSAMNFLVVSGLPKDAFTYIDQNKTRTLADALSIDGVTNHKLMVPTLKLLYSLHAGHYKAPRHEVLLRFVHDYAPLVEAIKFAQAHTKKILMKVHEIATLYFLYQQYVKFLNTEQDQSLHINPNITHEFFYELAFPGSDASIASKDNHPINKLRTRLIDDWKVGTVPVKGMSKGNARSRLMHRNDGSCITVTAETVHMWWVHQAFKRYVNGSTTLKWEPNFIEDETALNCYVSIKELRKIARTVLAVRHTYDPVTGM